MVSSINPENRLITQSETLFGQSKTERLRELVSGIMTEEELEKAHDIITEIEGELDGDENKLDTEFESEDYAKQRLKDCLENGHLTNIYESVDPLENVGFAGAGMAERRVELEFVVPIRRND